MGNGKRKDTFNTLLGAIDLGKLLRKNRFAEYTIHPTLRNAPPLQNPAPLQFQFIQNK